MDDHTVPPPEAEVTAPDKAKRTRPNNNRPPVTCVSCGDTGKVRLSLMGMDGPVMQEVPCPRCDAGVELRVKADAGEGVTREDYQRLARLVLIALALAGLAFLAQYVQGDRPESVFARAAKEVAE